MATRAKSDVQLLALDLFLAKEVGLTREAFLALPVKGIGAWLRSYGQHLYESGDAPGSFVDCLLAVVDEAPELRQQLQSCWDLADNWKVLMPFANHVPSSAVEVRALFALAILWGWWDVGLWILIAFVGLLRPIEVFRLRREDVILPHELLLDSKVAYIRIRTPKMKRLRARREHVKISCSLTVRLLEAWLVGLPPETVLFDFKPGVFRKLHDSVVRHFGFSIRDGIGLTPASHRGGGATALFERSQDLDLVRWTGRWSSASRTVEIYVQEIAAASALPSLTESQRACVSRFARAAYPLALHVIQVFQRFLSMNSSGVLVLALPQDAQATLRRGSFLPASAPILHQR